MKLEKGRESNRISLHFISCVKVPRRANPYSTLSWITLIKAIGLHCK